MKKMMTTAILFAMMVLGASVANATEEISCDAEGLCVTCDDKKGGCSWSQVPPLVKPKKTKKVAKKVKKSQKSKKVAKAKGKKIAHSGIVSAGGGYIIQKKIGLGLGLASAGYRFLKDVKEDEGTYLGFELKFGLGAANQWMVIVPEFTFLIYTHKHFGMGIGYAYLHTWNVGDVDPFAAHLGKLEFRIPVVDWFEINLYGTIGYSEYYSSQNIGLLKINTVDKSVTGGGGGMATFKF